MSTQQSAKLNELKELTGARDIRELCEFFGYQDASEFWEPIKEAKAAVITGLAIPTLRNYRHLSKGPEYIKHGNSVLYLPLVLHLHNFRNLISLEEVA